MYKLLDEDGDKKVDRAEFCSRIARAYKTALASADIVAKAELALKPHLEKVHKRIVDCNVEIGWYIEDLQRPDSPPRSGEISPPRPGRERFGRISPIGLQRKSSLRVPQMSKGLQNTVRIRPGAK